MTLSQLQTALKIVTGTGIGEVYFNWKAYENQVSDKVYPTILWQLDGAEFTEDYRSTTIQKVKTFTLTVYAMDYFNQVDQIATWDTLETKVKAYLNAMNISANIQIMNIDEIKGQYASEGLISADKEIGIMYKGVILKLTC